MANVPYQGYRPSAPEPETVIKTTGDNTTGHIQHVNIDQVPVTTRVNTGVKALTVAIGPTDPISDIPVVMLYDHHQLHEGEIFRYSVYVSSLASAASKDMLIVVPNITITSNAVTQCPHLRFEFLSSLGGRAYLYEGPTTSADGTERTPIAMERNGTYTPITKIYEDPVVDAVGTELWQGLFFSGRTSAGGMDTSATEFVLANNTKYLLRYTSAAASNEILMRFEWYEDLGV